MTHSYLGHSYFHRLPFIICLSIFLDKYEYSQYYPKQETGFHHTS